ncbi:MAG: alpha/beta fold hydrolase, partial [bacterium]|nr:alpha/beta fold hydrolase [bacterium]
LTGGYADGYTSSLYKAKINLVFPTPTPTPTPTDTPVARVFVIPGMGASWNADAMLNCKDEGYAGNWELAPYAEDIYNPLLQALNRSGHGVTPYYYDWRKDVRSHVPTLESLIQSQSSNSYLVGHSMGGLLGRAYLEVMRENSHLDKLLTVASPHQGAVTAYPAWSAGKIWEGNLVSRIALSIILNRCGSNTHEAIVNHVPAVQNLLPTFDYLYHKKDGQFLTVDTMVAQNNFSPTNLSVPFWGVNLGTLSGHGKETLYRLDIKDPSHSDDRLGIWTDGNPLKRYSNRNGDGTVLVSSSQISGADNRLVDNKNHLQIVSSAQGINQILDFLGMTTVLTSTLTSLESPEPNSALIILSPDSEVTFESGQNAKSAPGISVIFSPTRKDYRFLIKSKKQRSKMIVAQFLPDNSYLWKEYQLSPNQRSGYLKYDPNKIGNNILNW